MSDAKPADVAEALDYFAQHEQRPLVAATLQLAAAQLRNDQMVEERLTQLLALLPVERLIGVSALLLDQRAARGEQAVNDAASYLHAAGLMLMGSLE